MRVTWRGLIPFAVAALVATMAPPAYGAVSIKRAEVAGSQLRVEGNASASRDITVDGVVMGRSDGSGRFKISRNGYSPPADCTIDVNDGSPTARVATLRGCTVAEPEPEPEPEPAPAPVAQLTPDVDQIGPGYVGSSFVDFSETTTTITFGPDTLGPVRFEIIAGQLPDGLRLVDPNAGFTPAKSIHASVDGTPTTVQTSTFTIRATDANGLQATRTYTIVINPARTLEIVPQPWAPLKVGEFSNLWIDGKGGQKPYRWSVSAGTLPGGMSLVQDNPDGPLVRVTGTPTTAGTFTFTIRLVDAQSSAVSRSFSVTVAAADTSTGPAAPTHLAPSDGASVTTPFTIDWTEEFDPTLSANGGYNWQVSTSSTFSTLVLRDSTLPTVTQDTVSGIPAGTYFWRVQAVDGQLRSSEFSTPSSFTVTGSTTDQPGTPVLSLPPYGSSFHPFESFGLTWTAADRAVKYELLASKDAAFPAGSIKVDNIERTSTRLTIGDFCGGCEQGTYFARVVAIDAAGNRGESSNTVSFTISYDAPLPPPPSPRGPADGATVDLPVTLDWSDVPNAQDTGYEVEISRNASFTDIEEHLPQITPSERTVLSLTPGTKWWRVRSHHGNASPTTSAVTEWSAARSFTVAAEAALQSVWLGAPPCQDPCPGADTLTSGQEIEGSLQLTGAAPAGGADVTLTVAPSAGASVPASVTVPAGTAFATFRLFAGRVDSPTQVTLTATLGASSDTFVFMVNPAPAPTPSLGAVSLSPTSVTGGTGSTGTVTLTSAAPTGGTTVSLASSNTAAATVPASVLVPAGATSATFPATTQTVTTATSATITADHAGVTRSAVLTVNATTASTDTVSVQRAEYGSGRLRVEASSSSATVTMRVFVTSTGALIGTLGNDGGGRYRGELSWSTNPQNITVKSSAGGSASRTVTLK